MTEAEKAEIAALIEKEVARQLASRPRVVNYEPPRKVKHLPILSNRPDAKQ